MKPPRTGAAWILILIFVLLWAELIRQLGYHWTSNPQYAFGWTVPMLSLFLGWNAWMTRPSPGPAVARRGVLALIGIAAFLLLPTRLFLDATPDWRVLQWAFAIEIVGLSLCVVHLLGGRPWLRHFAFPIAFIFVAVPWPVSFEQPFVAMLSEVVAVLTVHGLNLCDIPAFKQGILIEVSTGVVGVEEACSGVRSFQATLMASLFLGQLWGFPWRPRLVLVGAGVALAFACNVARAWFLAYIAEKKGLRAIDEWHDPAGFTILAVCFLGLLALALWLRPKTEEVFAVNVPAARCPSWRFAAGLGAWIVVSVVCIEVWYRTGSSIPEAWWRVEWPTDRAGFTDLPIPDSMQRDEGRSARWTESDGSQWTVFFFRFYPGPAKVRIRARCHRPEFCLTSVGLKLIGQSDVKALKVGELELPYRTYRFEQAGRPIHVFYSTWEDRKPVVGGSSPLDRPTPLSYLKALVFKRDRILGQQVLEIAVTGMATDQEAVASFLQKVPLMLRPDPGVVSEGGGACSASIQSSHPR